MRKNKSDERLKEERLNNQGYLMKIVEYIDFNNITVEFQDEHKAKIHTNYKHFLSGQVKNPYHPTIFNVGILGDKLPAKENGKITKEYNTWSSMLRRCFDEKYKNKKPTYKDVTCCKEWLLFDNFYEWLHDQKNFKKWLSNDKWSIDKDILVKNNKIYSPETCCLVPNKINSLFIKNNAKRNNLPIGVQKHQKKYRACFNFFNKYTEFPVRDTVNEAFMDYKHYKEDFIKEVAKEEYLKENITKECYEAMMDYQVKIDD